MRAGTLIGQVHQDHIVQQLAIDGPAKLRRIDLDLTYGFALAVVDIQGQWPRIGWRLRG